MAYGLREGDLVLPDYEAEPLLDTYMSHLTSICVLMEEDDEGKVTEKVKNTGDDHFGHATGYALMGLEYRDDTGGGFAFVQIFWLT